VITLVGNLTPIKDAPGALRLRRIRVQFLLLIVAVVLARTAAAENAKTIQELAVHARDCCVRVASAGDQASGVLISDTGHILTVAHGIAPQAKTVRVQRNGIQVAGQVLLRDAKNDVALLRILPGDMTRLGVKPVAISKNDSEQGDLVLAAGFPARQAALTHAVVRFGTLMVKGEWLRSTCRLTAGDSGGPILNGAGHLIGINQKIGTIRDQNLHLAVESCLSAIQTPHQAKTVRTDSKLSVPKITTAARQSLTEHSAVVLDDKGLQLASATRVTSGMFVTKRSLIPSSSAIRVRWQSQLVAVQRETDTGSNDLLFLRSEDVSDGNVDFTVPAFGDVVWGVGGSPGIIGLVPVSEPKQRPSLGCTLQDLDGVVIVTRIAADSWAQRCGLKPGDALQQVGREKFNTLDKLGGVVSERNPGDRLSVTWTRDGERMIGESELDHPPESLLNRQEYLDGRAGLLSARRTGFQRVFQHDVAAGVIAMGGPVVDSRGRLVGVNIAVRSREAVLAIPIAEVLKARSENR